MNTYNNSDSKEIENPKEIENLETIIERNEKVIQKLEIEKINKMKELEEIETTKKELEEIEKTNETIEILKCSKEMLLTKQAKEKEVSEK